MSYTIVWKNSDVIVSFSETVTYQDFYKANNSIYGDSRFERMKYQIADFTNMKKFDFTLDEIKIISTLEKSSTIWNNQVKLAIVSTNIDFLQKIAHYIEAMKDTKWSLKIVESISTAEKWCII